MSNASTSVSLKTIPQDGPVKTVSVHQIFLEFLLIGATSFGGGVVAYLRSGLVAKRHWLDDKEFLELLSISQTLPGLNATNMATLVGDRLGGVAGDSRARKSNQAVHDA
jgi:chromate transporter